jgi:phosphoribosylanthranilate isomerase
MISPGTIRAASLISKGMSPEAAFQVANNIDVYTESRRSFLNSNPSTTTQVAPSASINSATTTTSPSTTVSTPTPAPRTQGISLGNINSSLSNTAIKPSKAFTTEEAEAINKLAASVQDPVKKKAISLGNPTALRDDQATAAGLAKLTPEQLGELGTNLQFGLIGNVSKTNYVPGQYVNKDYAKELLKTMDKLYVDYNSSLMEAPTVAGLMKAEHTKRLSSYQNLTASFANSKDFESLVKGYEGIVKELDLLDQTATSEYENAKRRYRGDRADRQQASLVVGEGFQDYQKNKNKYKVVKDELASVFNIRANAMLANEVLDVIDDRYKTAVKTNPQLTKEKFFEQQQKQYGLDKSAFGLGQILVESGRFTNYQEFIKFTNPTKYSKPNTIQQGFTLEDPYIKINTEALDMSVSYEGMSNVKGYDQTRNRETGDYRYADAKDDILFSGIKFAQSISEELDNRSINSIKEREQINKNYQKKIQLGTATKEDQQRYENRIAELDSQIDYADAFGKSIPETYKYDNLKNNGLVKGFAEDRRQFLEKEKNWNDLKNAPKQTAWYEDMAMSMYTGNFGSTQTGAYWKEVGSRAYGKAVGMGSDILKFTDQTLLNQTLGIPRSNSYTDRNKFYNYMRQRLDVPEVIDERASLMAGKTITSTTMFWSDPAKSWYDPSGWNMSWKGTLMAGAETLPQLYAFAGAGRAAQSLAGGLLQGGLRSGVTASLIGEANAIKFASTLQNTGSAASAWGQTFRNSNNFFLKQFAADRIPSAIGMSAVMYPEQYNRTLERLESQGVKNAHEIARNVALLSTGIELVAENIVPNLKYLDDFAEKGTGFKNLLGKTGAKKWIGDFDQYRALYSGVLGNNLSEKTINYLARNSAEILGQVGAATRFYVSRGLEEGSEEVFSEIVNGVIDAKTNFAGYRQEAPNELSFDGIINAFAGGFFVPSAGGSRQMKAYSENKKYSAMYDMMINGDYYKNKINTAFKAGEITQEQASDMLGKLQQVTSVSDEFGIQRLKRKTDAAKFTADLVNDEEKQFDYFKQILKVKGIEDKLAKDGEVLKDTERAALLEEADEATKRIDKYKRQVSVFENMSEDQKREIVNNTIAEKVQVAKFASTSTILAESIQNADNQLARAIQQKEPEYRIAALKQYRDNLIEASESRGAAKQVALDRGTYNPLIGAVTATGEATPLDLTGIDTAEDVIDLVVQSMLDPESGMDMYYHITGQAQRSLEDLREDKENLVENFLNHLEQTEAAPSTDNQRESTATTADRPAERVKYKTISDLNDAQQEMFEDLAEKLDDELVELEAKVDKYDTLLNQVLTHGAFSANMSLEQQEKFSDLVFKKFAAVKKVGFKTNQDKGSELFDLQDFGLYLGRNQKQIEKEIADIDAAVKTQEDTEKVEREEVSLEGLGEVAVEVPELVPTDITDAFTANLAALENIIEQQQVEVVENQITGETELLTDLPRERSRVINALVEEIAKNPDIKGAQAMMAAVMQTLGKSNEEIQKTLTQMAEVAENKPVNEVDYTHMFNLYQLARMTVENTTSTQANEAAAETIGALDTITENVVEVVEVPPVVIEPVVIPTATEEQKVELENKTQISSTTPIFRPTSKKDSVDLFHYEIQEAIITNLNKEVGDKKEVNTAIVDLFTVIEETLGEQTLTALETIFNQAISPAISKERLSELRSEFMSIFPNGFLKQSALYYMFDQIIVNKAAQSDVTEKGKEKLDATDEELLSLNRNRQVSIQMADGRKFPKVKVVSKEGSLLYAVDGGKEDGSTLWLKVDRTKDKVIGLKYPILGTRPIQFTDLNALMFTVLDKDGKVQKYSNDGNRNENADKVLGLYLPTAKYKANPTDTQKQFNGLRQRIVSGDRVKISTPVKAMSISTGILTIEQPNGSTITRNKDYSFEFSTENLSVREQGPSEAAQLTQAKEVKATSQAVTPTQQTTITAVEKMIADSKQIPDPSKQGYLINGKRYERQSNFVKRALGDTSIVTEDSIVNMEMGAAVGNLLDIIGRDILGGNKVKSLDAYIKEAEGMGKSLRSGKGYKINFTQEQFKQLVDELTEVKNELNEQGWKLFTEGLIVHREFTEKEKQETGSEGVAGAMDILAVDPEGKVHIIDFKNKKYRTQDKFTSTLYSSKQGYPSNVSKWSIQQTTYAILGEDFGLPVDSINILAFASEYAEANGVVTIGGLTLASKKAEVLDKHKSPYSSNLIRLGYDSKIIKHIELRTQKPSKKAAQVTPAAPKQLDLLTDQPRLTPEQVAEREAMEARQREMEFQEAMEIEELYMEYMAEKEAFELLDLPPEGEALEEMRVTRDSFVQFADKANLQGREGKAIILAYIGKRGQGLGLDIAAQRASDIAGREITPQDLVDFILKYPSGIGTLNSKTSDTYYGFNNPDNNPKYSSISKLIAERAKDAKRLAKQKGIKDLRENLPQIPTENAENVFDVLNLFGVDINSLGIVLPDEGSTDPDALNPPPCQ